jgi:hypothetical protein
MKRPGLKCESVLHAFMRRLFKRGQCYLCKKPMKTCDEPGFYIDNVCTRCAPDMLKLLEDQR